MPPKSEVLLVTDVPNLPASVIMWATETYGDKVSGGTALTVLTDILQTGGKLDFETSSVDVVISLAETPGFHNWSWLLEVVRVLKPGGDFWIQEPLLSRNPTCEERRRLASTPTQNQASLERSLLLAGFVNVEMKEAIDGVGLSSECNFISPSYVASINGALLKPVSMKVNKPTWDSGSTFAIKKKVFGHQGARLSEQIAQTPLVDTPPGGDEGDSHQHDHVNYSVPKLGSHLTPSHWKSISQGTSNEGALLMMDQHAEATVQTDVKHHRDVNVSAQTLYDRYDRYDQHTEAMVQTDVNISRDVLAGGDTPLPTSRGMKVTTSQMTEDFQPMAKRTFKLDLSSICPDQDYELVDDDELLTVDDYKFLESDSYRAAKPAYRTCSGGSRELDERRQQTEFPSLEGGRCQQGNDLRCASCGRSPAFVLGHKIILGRSLMVADVKVGQLHFSSQGKEVRRKARGRLEQIRTNTYLL